MSHGLIASSAFIVLAALTSCDEQSSSDTDASTNVNTDSGRPGAKLVVDLQHGDGGVDASGNWALRFEPGLGTRVNSVDLSGDGQVWLSGYFGCCRWADQPLSYGPPNPTGGVDFGGGPLSSFGFSDGFVASFSSDAVHQRSWSFGGPADDIPLDISVDRDSNIVASVRLGQGGDVSGKGPVFGPGMGESNVVSRIAPPSYVADWVFPIGMPGRNLADKVSTNGTVVVAVGSFSGNVTVAGNVLQSAGQSDIAITTFEGDGTPRRVRHFGGSGQDKATGVAINTSGEILIVGTFEGTVDFDGRILSSNGGIDAFVVLLNGQSEVIWAQTIATEHNESASGVALFGRRALVSGELGKKAASPRDTNVYLAAFDGNGGIMWLNTFPVFPSGGVVPLASDGRGTVAIGFSTEGNVDFGGGTLRGLAGPERVSVFFALFSVDGGVFLESSVLGTPISHEISDIAVDRGAVYVVGGTPGGEQQAGFVFRTVRNKILPVAYPIR
jgi:hypothetical protein